MKQQSTILILVNGLFFCTGNHQLILSPFAKAIERGDRLVLVQQQDYQTYRNTAHSIFYPYKKQVLKKLRIDKAESVYFMERFSVEEGKIYGTAWCPTDSLNYSFQFGALRFEKEGHVGNLPKQFKNWATAECPTIELGIKPSVHSNSFIVQRYDRAGHYKFCFYSF